LSSSAIAVALVSLIAAYPAMTIFARLEMLTAERP
jgi:hypothetical protein